VSLGVFCHHSIQQQLLDAVEDVGKEPISLTPPGRVSRYVLGRAVVLLDSEKDDKLLLSNYFKVSPNFLLKTEKRVGVHGYVFNSSDHLWQADPLYRMTAERSRVFLNSHLLGILPTRKSTWKEALQICMFAHFVIKRDDGTYECDCAAYWHSVECAHSYTAMDLDKVISVEAHLEAIPHGKRMGRKSNSEPLDYAAHPTIVTNRSEAEAVNFVGTVIARRLNAEKPSRIYVGRVRGKSFISK
jgi:hypothetical protein